MQTINDIHTRQFWRAIIANDDLRYAEGILICGHVQESALAALCYDRQATDREHALSILRKKLREIREQHGERGGLQKTGKGKGEPVLLSEVFDLNGGNSGEDVLTVKEEEACWEITREIRSRHGLFVYDCWGWKRGFEPWQADFENTPHDNAQAKNKATLNRRKSYQRPINPPTED